MHHFSRFLPIALLLSLPILALGQGISTKNIHGSFQTDVQYLFPDSIIGAAAVDEKVLSNTFLQLTYQQGNFRAGLRYEAYLNPLLGFDERYEGQGIAYRFAEYNSERLDLTVGNFYDQFGNGIVFRAYQEWALGIDNSVDGLRVAFRPIKGLQIKGVLGTQRKFFERSNSLLRGADLELTINDLLPALAESKTRLFLGGSVMNRYQADDDVRLDLPENVSAFSGRARLIRGGLVLDTEYAYKINDPFPLNDNVYNPGSALFVNANYSRKGFGLILAAKRIDNMDFRSERNVTLQELTLSFLPPISKLHTYRLPTLYPYATQFNGEVGFQASLLYNIPRKTRLGGPYGTLISVNYSRIHALDTTFVDWGYFNGERVNFLYETPYLGDFDNVYFQDVNIEINRKWNKKLRTILTHIYLRYNKDIIEFGTPTAGYGIVDVQATILETQYKINRKFAFRTEVQHMYTQQDLGSWAMLLAELSISPNWYFTVFDEYNYGNPDPEKRVHYYNASVAYAFEAHRISFSYSRQRRGLLCVGGICREVPASNGFGLSINSSF
ncbi:MAG: hypothetical protein D6722_07785 [Bacteroidetes bacterium]|nr:MAG: hypothetical protein D6722_07785 [Bacteroidota bacterium]